MHVQYLKLTDARIFFNHVFPNIVVIKIAKQNDIIV